MIKWIAVAACLLGLVAWNRTLREETRSRKAEIEILQGQLIQLRNSTQGAFNEVGTGDTTLRRQLDFRFNKVDGQIRELERRVQALEPKDKK